MALVEDTSFLLPHTINQSCVPPCLCSDSFYICFSRLGRQIPHSPRSDTVSLFAHSIVSQQRGIFNIHKGAATAWSNSY